MATPNINLELLQKILESELPDNRTKIAKYLQQARIIVRSCGSRESLVLKYIEKLYKLDIAIQQNNFTESCNILRALMQHDDTCNGYLLTNIIGILEKEFP